MKFDNFIKENWEPGSKYDSTIAYGKDVEDFTLVKQFIEYNGIDKLAIDIWEYISKNFKRYPSKITNRGMLYGANNNRKIEIEFSDKGIILWLFSMEYIDKTKSFDYNLISTGKFSFKNLKNMLER
jgi:hypothetical protein